MNVSISLELYHSIFDQITELKRENAQLASCNRKRLDANIMLGYKLDWRDATIEMLGERIEAGEDLVDIVNGGYKLAMERAGALFREKEALIADAREYEKDMATGRDVVDKLFETIANKTQQIELLTAENDALWNEDNPGIRELEIKDKRIAYLESALYALLVASCDEDD